LSEKSDIIVGSIWKFKKGIAGTALKDFRYKVTKVAIEHESTFPNGAVCYVSIATLKEPTTVEEITKKTGISTLGVWLERLELASAEETTQEPDDTESPEDRRIREWKEKNQV
jgi:hypothetical protein